MGFPKMIDLEGFAIADAAAVKINDGEWQVNATIYPASYLAVPPIKSRERYFSDPEYHALVHSLEAVLRGKSVGIDELLQALRIAVEFASRPAPMQSDGADCS